MNKLIKILPHFTIALSVMFITFWVLDILNPIMNFIDNSISNKLLLIFCIFSFSTSIITVYLDRKYNVD